MSSFVAPPKSAKVIKNLVNYIRKACSLENSLYMPVVEFLELIINQIDPGFMYDYVYEDELPPNTYAYYNPATNTMRIRVDVYERAYNGSGRDRYTIAHEIGHYFLHRNDVVLARNVHPSDVKPYQDPEWQANTFASEFLMPEDLIKDMGPAEVSRMCQTSHQAASIACKKAKKSSF